MPIMISRSDAISAEEIKNARKDRKLLNAEIEVTGACTWQCLYCYAHSGKPSPDEPTIEDIYKVIENAAESGLKTVTFTGGDPLLRPDFFSLAEYALKREVMPNSYTNGSQITPELARRLADYKVVLCMNINALDREIQNRLAGVPDAYEHSFNSIEYLKEAGYGNHQLPLYVHTTLTALNAEDTPKLYKYLQENGVHHFVDRLIPRGRGTDENLLPSLEQIQRVFEAIAEINRSKVALPFASDVVGEVGCVKLSYNCFIKMNGDVQPCSNIPIIAGNARKQSLLDIWNNSDILKKMSTIGDQMEGKCKTCKYNEVCFGCRSTTYAITSNLAGEDEYCWY